MKTQIEYIWKCTVDLLLQPDNTKPYNTKTKTQKNGFSHKGNMVTTHTHKHTPGSYPKSIEALIIGGTKNKKCHN